MWILPWEWIEPLSPNRRGQRMIMEQEPAIRVLSLDMLREDRIKELLEKVGFQQESCNGL